MRRNLFILFLTLVLGCLASWRIIVLSRAQTWAIDSCVDLLDYMGPNGPGYGLLYCAPGRSGSEGPIQATRKTVETLAGPKEGFEIIKGGNKETYFYDDQWIYFYEDTSWDRTCLDGSPAFYRVKDALTGQWGGKIKRFACLGETLPTSTQTVVAFNKETGQECSSQYAGTSAVSYSLQDATGNQYGPASACFPDGNQTIALVTLGGGSAGEQKFYTKGYGLTGFYVNQPGGDSFHSTFNCGDNSTELVCDDSGLPDVSDIYHRFVYPFYQNTGNVEADSAEMVRQLSEAYDVSCVPKAVFSAAVNGDVGELIDFGGCAGGTLPDGSGCLFDRPSSTFSLTTLTDIFGVLRNETEVKRRTASDEQNGSSRRYFTNRFESVEQWFGANNPSTERYVNNPPTEIKETHQGPFYKLASQEMQCRAALDILRASEELCKEWDAKKAQAGDTDPPAECPLRTYPVRGSNTTIGALYQRIPQSFCDTYFDPNRTTLPSALEKSQLSDVLNVDLYMELAYRPAFIVMVVDVDKEEPPIGPDNQRQKTVVKRRDGQPLNQATDNVVDYLMYHVPATLTDLDYGDLYPGRNENYTDVVKQTSNLILPQQFITDFNTKVEQYRTQVKSALNQPIALPPVRCYEPECVNEPLRRALIQYLNVMLANNLNFKYRDIRFDMSCEEDDETQSGTKRESGQQIGSALAPNDSFSDVERSKANAQIGDRDLGEGSASINLQQYFDRGGGVVSPREPIPPRIKMYNISPHRANTEYVATSYDMLFTQAQIADDYTPETGYYDKFEAFLSQRLDQEAQIHTYSKPVVDELGNPVLDPVTGLQLYEQKEVASTVNLNPTLGPFSARFEYMAKIFNHSTRAIVQQIFSEGTSILQCARALANPARNTEEFLLNCQNKGGNVPAAPE